MDPQTGGCGLRSRSEKAVRGEHRDADLYVFKLHDDS